jgi:2-methylcitrate dehydratase PrpD
VALVAGECTSAQFTDKWLRHPLVAKLMAVSTLEAKAELTARYKQGARPAVVEVKTRRGTFTREVPYPKGDPNNPMTWVDVTLKFMQQAEPVLGPTRAGEIVERCRAIEAEADMRAFARSLSGG